jgi:hypothetical protein
MAATTADDCLLAMISRKVIAYERRNAARSGKNEGLNAEDNAAPHVNATEIHTRGLLTA